MPPTLSPLFLWAQAIFQTKFFPYKYSTILKPNHHLYLSAYEDGKERMFRNVGIYNSDSGELPRRKHATFRRRRKFEIKNVPIDLGSFRIKPFPYKDPNILENRNFSYLPAYKDRTECSETSAYKILTPGNYPKENIQHSEQGENLK
jgi:hypothetical protein